MDRTGFEEVIKKYQAAYRRFEEAKTDLAASELNRKNAQALEQECMDRALKAERTLLDAQELLEKAARP